MRNDSMNGMGGQGDQSLALRSIRSIGAQQTGWSGIGHWSVNMMQCLHVGLGVRTSAQGKLVRSFQAVNAHL